MQRARCAAQRKAGLWGWLGGARQIPRPQRPLARPLPCHAPLAVRNKWPGKPCKWGFAGWKGCAWVRACSRGSASLTSAAAPHQLRPPLDSSRPARTAGWQERVGVGCQGCWGGGTGRWGQRAAGCRVTASASFNTRKFRRRIGLVSLSIFPPGVTSRACDRAREGCMAGWRVQRGAGVRGRASAGGRRAAAPTPLRMQGRVMQCASVRVRGRQAISGKEHQWCEHRLFA